jgi:hypothetical protein
VKSAGLPTHIQKAVFSVIENPIFLLFLSVGLLFCPLGSFLELFLKRREG